MKTPMNTQETTRQSHHFAHRMLVSAWSIALMGVAIPAWALTDVSGIPLYALEGVPPNIALTIDDSGSMAWGYVPDAKSVSDNSNPGKRWVSSAYNAMYYNPNNLYPAPSDQNNVLLSTSWPNAWRNGFDTSKGSVDLSSNYKATVSYNPNNSSDSTDTAVLGFHYAVLNLSNSGCDTSAKDAYGAYTDNDCYTSVSVSSTSGPGTIDLNADGAITSADKDERQNFANWYSFYRTRNLATVSAASLAFSQLHTDFRVAFQNLHTCDGFDTSCKDRTGSTYDSRVSTFDGTARSNFFKWLQRSPASGGTPLLDAAERSGEMFKGSRPYDKVPGSVTTPQYECRSNFSIVMTDGIWNTDYANNVGDYDNSSHTLPDGQNYSPASPYKKSNSNNNMADVALKYWAEDLSTLPASNALQYMPVESDETFGSKTFSPYWNPKNDPATWQHMVTYTIGLGLGGILGSDWAGNMYSGAFPSLADGTKAWPDTAMDAIPGNVYDLWHAAVNGRGRFYSAESPDDVVKAFEEIIKGISDRQGTAVAASLSGSRIATDTFVYQTNFNTTDWSGNLFAYGVSDGSGSGGTCNSQPLGTVCAGATWQAASQLDNKDWSSGRAIITNSSGGKPFRWANISASQQSLLNNGDTLGDKRLQFLRGDRTLEGTTFRKRGSVMGDIINSSPAPLYVGAPSFYYPGDSAYTSFRTTYNSRRKMVYVGGNDGMLHAFDAMTGAEVFAFIPNAVYPNLYKLTRKDYNHASYVDGGMISYDIKIGGSFKTYLFGGLGLGGKAIYALDITDPSTFSEGNAANIFKWEFTDANLGYTFGKPKIVTLRTGETAVIFGSGYTDGTTAAALYVVNASTGALIARLAVPTNDGGGTTFSDNGISGITAIDLHGATPTDPQDGYVDAVYAGDLYGNLWKFDFTTNTPVVAYGGKPMYVAKDNLNKRQPITTEPAVSKHPTGNGVIVYFGTGKYLGASDTTTTQLQTFYAIWNKQDAHNTNINRTHLLKQEISTDYTTTFTNTDARTTTNKPIYWHDTDDDSLPGTGRHLGWYLDLNTESRERVHQAPFLRGDRIIFVTVTPSDNPCNAGGSSWIYELQAVSGSRLKNLTPFDYNQDGKFDSTDFVTEGGVNIPASGIRLDGAGVYYMDKESVLDCQGHECKMVSTSNGGVVSLGESSPVGLRRTWRELLAE